MVTLRRRSSKVATAVFVAFYVVFVARILTKRRGFPDDNFEVVGWEKGVSTKLSDYIDVDSKDWRPNDIDPFGPYEQLRILITVHSAVQNNDKREFVRTYFGKECSEISENSCRLIFILGSHYKSGNGSIKESFDLIKEEYEENGDLFLGDFVDSYYNLTLKSLHATRFFANSDLNFTHMFKVDDNCYFNPRVIKSLLNSLKANSDSVQVIGKLWAHTRVVRNTIDVPKGKRKFITPRYLYEKEFYPNYLGTSYVLSREAAKCILQATKKTRLFFLEDVYMTGILCEVCISKYKKSKGMRNFNRIDAGAERFWLFPLIRGIEKISSKVEFEETEDVIDLKYLAMAHLEGPNWRKVAVQMLKASSTNLTFMKPIF